MLRKPIQNNIQHIFHALNKSPSKNVYSFTQSQRFKQPKSQSPDTYYNIPSSFGRYNPQNKKSKKSIEKYYFSPLHSKLHSSLDFKKQSIRSTTFGISRQDYYKGKKDELDLGPAAYNVSESFNKKPFYIGRKTSPPKTDRQKNTIPNCASYVVTSQSYKKLSTNKANGNVKMKTQYYPKDPIQKYNNQVPGPGSYNKKGLGDLSQGYRQSYQKRKNNSTFGVGEKIKKAKYNEIGPGSYPIFSEFGRSLLK